MGEKEQGRFPAKKKEKENGNINEGWEPTNSRKTGEGILKSKRKG
jgi:hypothetical protein